MTGGTGFIGQHLLSKIVNIQNYRVYQLKSDVLTLEPGDILRTRGDLNTLTCDEEKRSEVKTLLLLGSYTPKSSNSPQSISDCIDSINVTQKLCSGIFPNLVKVIFISSMDVYKRSSLLIDESSELEISNCYIATKLMCEHIVENYCKENKLNFDILRVGHIYGYGDFVYEKVFSNLVRAIKLGNTFKVNGDVEQSLNLLYVKDLISVILQSVENKETAGLLNVVSSSNVTIKNLIEVIEHESNLKLKVEVMEGTGSKFQYKFNNEKLKQHYILKETPLSKGVAETLQKQS
jgi:UDP-glucose 4-epimerase